jgi:hypothetical protein
MKKQLIIYFHILPFSNSFPATFWHFILIGLVHYFHTNFIDKGLDNMEMQPNMK